MAHSQDIAGILKGCRIGGAVFTACAAIISFMFGWSFGSDFTEKLVYGVALGAASGVVGYGLVVAFHAYKARLWSVAIAATACFIIALVVEMVGHYGYAASVRNHNIQIASEQTNVYTDTRGELERARKDLASLKQVKPAAALEAELGGMRSRIGWERSRQCTDPGSYTTFCRQYASTASDLAVARQRAALDQRITQLAGKSETTTAGHSAAEAQIKAIAALATRSTRPGETETFWVNQGVTALLTLFLVVTGGLLNFMGHGFTAASPSPTGGQRAPGNDNRVVQFAPPAPLPAVGPLTAYRPVTSQITLQGHVEPQYRVA